MTGAGPDGKGTGNRIVTSTTADATTEVDATTLDELFADRVRPDDRALLKLDLEAHELMALRGASRLLAAVEVVVSEVQFCPINDNGLPTFTDLVLFLRECGFDLYDFASLLHRSRDMRLMQGDIVLVRRGTALLADRCWQ
jgi:hypothetical protein